ncbi:MAG: hypothetical protein PQJ46_02890 [Spirochaetales bacterium]|nr:hypothetical protein [Spirochaetales bacterium]
MNNLKRIKIFLILCFILIFIVGCTKVIEKNKIFVCNTNNFEGFYKVSVTVEAKVIKSEYPKNPLELNILISNAKIYLFETIGEMSSEEFEEQVKNKKLVNDTIFYLNNLKKIKSYKVKNVIIEIEKTK